ncbi:MAG: NAD(P)-dependent oxidoreductase [Parvularculaceae bacterium]|nr:NAD(P)-dependent oxidoreductase [Parvularculaceae bacterium]
MLRFVDEQRRPPEKRAADARNKDFLEIDEGFATEEGAAGEVQASRCSQCGVPFCSSGCPLGNHIPDWLRLSAEGEWQEAYRMSSSTSALPEICGRICPQDRLCEQACVIEQSGHGTVTIGAMEKTIGDKAWDEGWVEPIRPAQELDASVGIIGAGPAGLAAADRLRELGYQVTIYDRYDRAGGLLTYGIPGFKLEKPVVMRRVERLQEAGVAFVQNADVGSELPFAEVRAKHDAVLIATGVYKARQATMPAPVGAVIPALSYLTASNRKGFGDEVPLFESGDLNAEGKRVAVIGGGDTAMDCVRTAIRQGAKSVSCLYRRDRANMPGSAREVQHAEEEGVQFRWLTNPKAVAANKDGSLDLRTVQMRLGPKDRTGRQQPEETNKEDSVAVDMVIAALGFEPEDVVTAFGLPNLEVSRRGTLRVDGETFETAEPGVFAAGDIVRGASLVVWAVHDGQRAAAGIHERLSQPVATETNSVSNAAEANA